MQYINTHMYTLRVINKEGLEHNLSLGESYNYVNRFTHYDEFQRAYKVIFGIDHIADLDEMSNNFSKNCYGIVTFKDGRELRPLYMHQQNFIMTESGKTFSNLTHK